MHFSRQSLFWWRMRSAASPLLPSASLVAVCQMTWLGPYTCTAVPFTAWVALDISVNTAPSVQPYFIEDGWELWLFYNNQELSDRDKYFPCNIFCLVIMLGKMFHCLLALLISRNGQKIEIPAYRKFCYFCIYFHHEVKWKMEWTGWGRTEC